MGVRISFVVLHYVAMEMTQICVDTLLRTFSSDDIDIVVVDNASWNGSGKNLQKMYGSQPRVHLLLSDTNLGFAKGNNLGYRYAIRNLSPDFIVVMNNDVLITQGGFIPALVRDWNESGFAVLGPDIVSQRDGRHQSPCWNGRPVSREDIVRIKEKADRKNRLFFLQWLGSAMKAPFKKVPATPENEAWRERKEDVVLHGACIVFSKTFMDVREDAFNPGTFLYLEEEILWAECRKAGLKILYDPSLSVKHLEDVSTMKTHRSSYSRERLVYINRAKSAGVFLKVADEG